MAHQILDRVQETTTSTGTGALTLAGAVSKMLGLAAAGFSNGDTFLGLIEHASAAEWEIALCTFASAGAGSITRATPLKSSTGSAVNFSAGTKTISLIRPAAPHVRPIRTITSGTSTTMTAADYELVINKTVSAAHAVTLPPSPVAGQVVVVSDGKGDLDVGVYNITVAAASGNINGAASFVMQAAYQSATFRYSGTQWNRV